MLLVNWTLKNWKRKKTYRHKRIENKKQRIFARENKLSWISKHKYFSPSLTLHDNLHNPRHEDSLRDKPDYRVNWLDHLKHRPSCRIYIKPWRRTGFLSPSLYVWCVPCPHNSTQSRAMAVCSGVHLIVNQRK